MSTSHRRGESDANFLPFSDADNLLHPVLSLAMITLGLIGPATERRTAGAGRPRPGAGGHA